MESDIAYFRYFIKAEPPPLATIQVGTYGRWHKIRSKAEKVAARGFVF